MIYKKLIKDRINDDVFLKACNESSSMAEAAAYLNLHFNSFKKRAIELNCYNPNQSGKGLKKISPQIPLSDIIEKGIYPHYQTYKLKNRLIKEGLKNNVCETCGCTSWLDKQLNLELHHADGNRRNHVLSNLKMLCPNCHSQTDFFRAKNKKFECPKGNFWSRTLQIRGNLIGNSRLVIPSQVSQKRKRCRD